MSQPLAPCPSCNRHVFVDACACPFCAAKLSPKECAHAAAPAGYRRLSRAARLAIGAALVGASACGTATPVYGAPFPRDAAPDVSSGAGGQAGAGSDGAVDATGSAGAGGASSSGL